MSNEHILIDYDNISLEELEQTVSMEASFNPVNFVKLIWRLYKWYKRFQDSRGKQIYREGSKLFIKAQKAKFKYGMPNAISIGDKKAVSSYLLAHREDKYKQLFKTVESLADGSLYKLQGLNNKPETIANFIAEDIANYPNMRSAFTFSVPDPIINTLDSRTYDKINSLLVNTFSKSNYAPFLSVFTGWSSIENRFDSVIKTLNELIQQSTASKQIVFEYTQRNIATLSLSEFDFNVTSFDNRLDGYIVKGVTRFLTIATSAEGWSAKSKVPDQIDIFINVTKELIRANTELTSDIVKPINKYFEELIKLTESDDFKAR